MPAVAPLAAILIALLALLLIYALEILGKILARMFPSFVPGIPGLKPRVWIESGVSALQAIIKWIIGDVVRPMVNLILTPVIAVTRWITAVEQFIVAATAEVGWIVDHGIPSAIHAVRSYAHRLYTLAESYAHRLYVAAEHYAAALAAAVHHYAHTLYVAAEHYARRIVDALEAALTASIAAVHHYAHELYVASEHYAQRIVANLRADVNTSLRAVEAELSTVAGVSVGYVATHIADAVKAAEAFTSTAVAGVIQVVDVDAIKGITAAWDGILIDIDALEGVIGLDLPDIGAAVRAIPRAIPTDLAEALTIVGAISIPMLRYMAKCGVPNCRNLSKIGRDLAELFTVLEGASFLALVAFIVTNPDEAAHEAHDVLGPVAHDLMGAARDLIGI